MNKNRIIQIIAILTLISIALIAIGISANEAINEKPQYQKNSWCPDTDDCPQPYCNYEQQDVSNSQPRTCCGRRN